MFPTGIRETWVPATRGGKTNPCSSPWIMIMAPIKRVDEPQDVVCTYVCWLSSFKNLISKASAKF